MVEMKKWVLVVFTTGLLYQLFHWIEHVAQMYQHWLLGINIAGSHGILFFLDFEWNHFVFNTIYFIALTLVFFGGKFYKYRNDSRKSFFLFVVLALALVVQGYHQIEHIMKIYQHYANNCEPCPGILGKVTDGIYLHFAFNSIVLALPAFAYIHGGFYKKLLVMLKGENTRTNIPESAKPI